MARDHIEFVQSQRLPWHRGLYGGARPDVDVRTLSFDAESRESSLVIRYPEGWRQDGPVRLAADEEFLVLEGHLTLNGQRYGHHDYAYLPAGYLRTEASSGEGAVILTFFSGEPRIDLGLPDPDVMRDGMIEKIDMAGMPWDYKAFPEMRPGCGMKYLRADPRTGDETWLLTSPPHGMPPGGAGAQETHPTVEEVFVLTGDLHGNCGVMQQGAYFWRPPHILHGPYGSRLGATSFYRTKGGPLVAEWTQAKVPFAYDPPYTPFLPDGLVLEGDEGDYGGRPY